MLMLHVQECLHATKLSFWGHGCFLGCLTCVVDALLHFPASNHPNKASDLYHAFSTIQSLSAAKLPFWLSLPFSLDFPSFWHQLCHAQPGKMCLCHSMSPFADDNTRNCPTIGTSLMFSASSSSSLSSKMPSNPCNHFGYDGEWLVNLKVFSLSGLCLVAKK